MTNVTATPVESVEPASNASRKGVRRGILTGSVIGSLLLLVASVGFLTPLGLLTVTSVGPVSADSGTCIIHVKDGTNRKASSVEVDAKNCHNLHAGDKVTQYGNAVTSFHRK